MAMLMLQGGVATPEVIRLDPVLQRHCADGSGNEIVVCANRGDQQYRLPRLDTERFEPDRAVNAEIGLVDGMKGAAEVESTTLLGGQVSNRVMLRLKMQF